LETFFFMVVKHTDFKFTVSGSALKVDGNETVCFYGFIDFPSALVVGMPLSCQPSRF
jgi:hypothetical protein